MRTTALMIDAFLALRHDPAGVPDEHFWQLVERFRAGLVNQAFALLGNYQDAEDVSQETLCKAFLELHTLRDASKLGVWLRSINRCHALMWRRRRKRNVERRLATGELAVVPDSGSAGDAASLEETLIRAVDDLPSDLREVVVLRYWEKLSTDRIAVLLDLPPGTVRCRLSRADGLIAGKLNLAPRREERCR